MAKLFIEDNYRKRLVMVGEDSDPTPTGFADETSIEGVGNCVPLKDIMEYKQIRTWIYTMLVMKDYPTMDIATAFGLCTPAEQKMVCKFFIMPWI